MRMPLPSTRALRWFATIAAFAFCLAAPAQAAKGKKKAAPAPTAAAKPAPDGDDNAGDDNAGGEDQPKVKVERGAGGKKVYKIEGEIVIEGKIQKPEAFYVLQKSSINYDWHELKQEFVPKILNSVTKSPF
jgi:hypothetical protein